MLFLGLLSCSNQDASLDMAYTSQDVVHLELSYKNNVVPSDQDNKPFIEGVDFIELTDSKLLVRVDVAEVDVEDAKHILNAQGFKVVKQYNKKRVVTNKPISAQNEVDRSIQIPEITFPNIFKALVVFYR